MDDNKFNNGIVGFLMGFFLGCLGLIIAMVIGGPSTKKGAMAGFATMFLISICLGVLGSVLQVVLANS